MFDRLYAVLRGEAAPQSKSKATDAQVAVGALLVEAAFRDDVFGTQEREAIRGLLAERFDLDASATDELLLASEQAKSESLELFSFVRKLLKDMDEPARVEVIEMLWEVAYADGALDAHEDAMIRKVAGLLYVSDFDRGAARRRVRDRLGLAG
jgi:uncharacterized tellurite resistance protein B-like protein